MPEVDLVKRQFDEDLEKVEATRAEKVLALALVVFLLVGGFWVLNQLESIPPRPDYEAMSNQFHLAELRAEVQELQSDLYSTEELLNKQQARLNEARTQYEFRREEYRTALDSGIHSPEKEEAYELSLKNFEEQQLETDVVRKLVEVKQKELRGPEARLEAREAEFFKAFEAANQRYQLQLFLLRFGYAAPAFGLATYAWIQLRKRGSRHLIIATAFLAFTAIQLLVISGIYAWHLLRDLAQIAVSVAGSVVSVAGLVTLRRYIFNFERIARSRSRRGQCPYCGFPAGPGAGFCRECGRALAEPCPSCSASRPVLSQFCPACGAGSASGPETDPATS